MHILLIRGYAIILIYLRSFRSIYCCCVPSIAVMRGSCCAYHVHMYQTLTIHTDHALQSIHSIQRGVSVPIVCSGIICHEFLFKHLHGTYSQTGVRYVYLKQIFICSTSYLLPTTQVLMPPAPSV